MTQQKIMAFYAFNCSRKEIKSYFHNREQGIKHCRRILDKVKPGWRKDCKNWAFHMYTENPDITLKNLKMRNSKKSKKTF